MEKHGTGLEATVVTQAVKSTTVHCDSYAFSIRYSDRFAHVLDNPWKKKHNPIQRHAMHPMKNNAVEPVLYRPFSKKPAPSCPRPHRQRPPFSCRAPNQAY
jgi:hypothetical protein